jgi:hypothetical protein
LSQLPLDATSSTGQIAKVGALARFDPAAIGPPEDLGPAARGHDAAPRAQTAPRPALHAGAACLSRFGQQMPLSLEADHRRPAPTAPRRRAWRAPARCLNPDGNSNTGNAQRRSRAGKQRDLGRIELNAVRVPHPARSSPDLRIIAGAATEFLEAVAHIVGVFGQWVCIITPLSRASGAHHQLAADRKRRTRRHAHAHHRAIGGRRGMRRSPDHVVQNGASASTRLSGGRPPRLAHAHRPARGVKADADGLRGGNRVFQPHAIGKQIEMVGRKRAARQRQLGQPQPRRINTSSGV